jgi:hypothetical protein
VIDFKRLLSSQLAMHARALRFLHRIFLIRKDSESDMRRSKKPNSTRAINRKRRREKQLKTRRKLANFETLEQRYLLAHDVVDPAQSAIKSPQPHEMPLHVVAEAARQQAIHSTWVSAETVALDSVQTRAFHSLELALGDPETELVQLVSSTASDARSNHSNSATPRLFDSDWSNPNLSRLSEQTIPLSPVGRHDQFSQGPAQATGFVLPTFAGPQVDRNDTAPSFSLKVHAADVDGALQQNTSSELLIIDSAVEEYETLISQLDSHFALGKRLDVVVLEAGRDGVEQITDAVTVRNNLSAIHIVSHGSSGLLRLGSTSLNNQSLGSYSGQISQWRDSMTASADILLYGCNLAADAAGVRLVENLAAITDADVAASIDLTGQVNLGGDWVLEQGVGVIEATVFAPEYSGLLNSGSGNVYTAQDNDFDSADPIVLKDTDTTLDLTALDSVEQVTVTQVDKPTGKQKIIVKKSGNSGNSDAIYWIEPVNGKVGGLILGHGNKLVLEGPLDKLDLAKVDGLEEVAIRTKTDTSGWLRTTQSVDVIVKTGATLDTLKVGKAASGNDSSKDDIIDLYLGEGARVENLERAHNFETKLKLHYPEDSGSKQKLLVDLTKSEPNITGIGKLIRFTEQSIAEIQTEAGKQVVRLKDTADVKLATGAGSDR